MGGGSDATGSPSEEEVLGLWPRAVEKEADRLYEYSKLGQLPNRVLDCVERNFWPQVFTYAADREAAGLALPPPEAVAGRLFSVCLNGCL